MFRSSERPGVDVLRVIDVVEVEDIHGIGGIGGLHPVLFRGGRGRRSGAEADIDRTQRGEGDPLEIDVVRRVDGETQPRRGVARSERGQRGGGEAGELQRFWAMAKSVTYFEVLTPAVKSAASKTKRSRPAPPIRYSLVPAPELRMSLPASP